jgi:hypothetical protein
VIKKEFLRLYKVPLLLALTLFLALIAIKVEKNMLNIALMLLGSLFGTFLLDLDYVIHAYFVEPEKSSSNLIKDYVKHKDYLGLLVFGQTHKSDFEDLTLNSSLFQLVLGGAAIFVMTSDITIFLKVLVASAFLNSIYRFLEEYMKGNVQKWFWSFKIETKPMNIYLYVLVLLAGIIYDIYIFF